MRDDCAHWVEALEHLGLRPEGPAEDGVRYVRTTPRYVLEATVSCWCRPARVRIVVRLPSAGPLFLLLPRADSPAAPEATTGDAVFDEQVAIVRGASRVLPRLGSTERRMVAAAVGGLSATLSSEAATLEPSRAARVLDTDGALEALHLLCAVAPLLPAQPTLRELLRRWWTAEEPTAVREAVAEGMATRLPRLGADDAAVVCDVLSQQAGESARDHLAQMPLHPVVLRTWLSLGRGLEEDLVRRVRESLRGGSVTAAGEYVVWLLGRMDEDPEAGRVLGEVWGGPEAVGHPELGAAVVAALGPEPPHAARALLQEVMPRSATTARQLARALAHYQHPACDATLFGWLGLPGPDVRRAAAEALAERVHAELGAGRPRQVAAVAEAARTSLVLVGALVRGLPRDDTWWLAQLRPQSERATLALIQRLGEGGGEVDQALLYWLERGTRAVQLAAASALATAGSPRALPALQERAGGWFGDASVRDRCRQAARALRGRVGAPGTLALARQEGGAVSLLDDTGDE